MGNFIWFPKINFTQTIKYVQNTNCAETLLTFSVSIRTVLSRTQSCSYRSWSKTKHPWHSLCLARVLEGSPHQTQTLKFSSGKTLDCGPPLQSLGDVGTKLQCDPQHVHLQWASQQHSLIVVLGGQRVGQTKERLSPSWWCSSYTWCPSPNVSLGTEFVLRTLRTESIGVYTGDL